VVTVLIGVTAEGLVHSVDGLASRSPISKEFIGFILLPIVGNAPECFAAVTVSVKDKLTSGLVATVGSSIVSSLSLHPDCVVRLRVPHSLTPLQQTSLFVIPFIVILGWMIGRPITMLFDPLECIALFFSVLVVNYVVQNGRSNWLEGMILICSYVWLSPRSFLISFFLLFGADVYHIGT
jgi:Ca2+:H+ antiporter